MSEDTKAPEFPQPKTPQATPSNFMMQFFSYAHLPPHLQEASKPFHDMATWMLQTLPYSRMLDIAIEKLVEAKDAAVRAKLAKHT